MGENIKEWRDIDEFDGYLISKNGECFSQKTKKILKPHFYPNGYMFYSFKVKGKQYTRLIHRLVANAFIPNPDNKPQVDHINTDKTDNRAENLRWVTQSENNTNPITRKRMSEGIKNSKDALNACVKNAQKATLVKKKCVYQYTLEGKYLKKYDSITDASKENNCFAQNISQCCKGKNKSCKGYIWSYFPL